MARIEKRLNALETIWPQPLAPIELDWSRLTDDELAEYRALNERAFLLGGIDKLTDAEIFRGADLADKLLNDAPAPPTPTSWPDGWTQ